MESLTKFKTQPSSQPPAAGRTSMLDRVLIDCWRARLIVDIRSFAVALTALLRATVWQEGTATLNRIAATAIVTLNSTKVKPFTLSITILLIVIALYGARRPEARAG